jgi:hypothetical protein
MADQKPLYTEEQQRIVREYEASHFVLRLPVDSNEALGQFLYENCPDRMDAPEESDPMVCDTHNVSLVKGQDEIYHCPVNGCKFISWY